MKITAYEWISGLNESVPIKNIGLNKKVQKRFESIDSIENATQVSSDMFSKLFTDAVNDVANSIKFQINRINTSYNKILADSGEDAGVLMVMTTNIDNSDDIVQFGIFSFQYANDIVCWPYISKVDNLNDKWHKKCDMNVLYVRGKEKIKDILYDKEKKEQQIDLINRSIYRSFDIDDDFLYKYQIDVNFAPFHYFKIDNIDEYVSIVKKCADIVKDIATIKNLDMQYKQSIANKIRNGFEVVNKIT